MPMSGRVATLVLCLAIVGSCSGVSLHAFYAGHNLCTVRGS